MKKSVALLAAILVLLVFEAAAQKVKDTPVTSAIENADLAAVPYRLQSDSLGAYQNGVSSVESIVQGIGDWELDLLASPTRRVFVDFGDPVLDSNPNPPASGFYPVRFLSQCSARGYNLRNLAAGATVLCPMIVAVDVGADRFSLRFNAVNFPGTNDVAWTCTAAASGKCTAWRLRSVSGETSTVVAQLLKITIVRNRTTEEARGKFNFSFDVGLTAP
jgi:hypothetical protein